MKIKPLPSLEYLKEAFSYCKRTGTLRWKIRSANCIHIGDAAGNHDSRGHLQVRTKFGLFFVHRIAWFLCTGDDPGDFQIDHANQVRDDNRWKNLRLTTHNGNAHNATKRVDNTSGVKGISWHKGAWVGRVMHHKKTYWTAYYADLEGAKKAIQSLRQELHLTFTSHG